MLDHELQVPDRLVLERPVLGQRALGQPGLVERVRDPLPLVPQVCDQLVREVVGHVLQGALIGQRAA